MSRGALEAVDRFWNARDAVFFFRNVAAAVIAVLLCLLPEAGPNRFWLAAFLVLVCIPVATWLERSYPIADTAWIQPLFDLGVIVTAVHLVPQLWFPVLVLGLVIVQAPSVAENRRSYLYHALFAVILTAGMAFAAVMHDVPGWKLPILAMAVLYPSVIYYAHRQAMRTNELRDRAGALSSLSRVAGGVAHDFNNLLAAVMGHAELVLSDLAPDHPARASAEQVVDGATRASLLSARLLAFAGRDAEADGCLDLEAEVEAIVALMRPAVPKGIELELHSTLEGACIRASPLRLQQIVMNLVLNASQAGQELPGRVRVELSRTSDEGGAGWLALRVCDEGRGIPPALRSRIFDAHFTLKEHGHGLGLASAQDAAREIGGRIEVESVEGEGTRICVLLPEGGRGRPAVGPPAAASLREIHRPALVVDDEPAIRVVLSRMLEGLGYTVQVAADGSEALEVARKNGGGFDLVVLDLRMPGMDGWECLRGLRAIREDLPVLVCSGHDPREGVRPDDPWLGFLAKPFRQAELEAALERTFHGSQERSARAPAPARQGSPARAVAPR